MNGKKIVIFGGSGFLGRNIINRYYEQSNENQIFSVSRSETRIVDAQLHVAPDAASFIVADMADKQAVEDIIFRIRPDIVIIASAMKHIHLCEKNPEQTVKINVNGTINILNAVDKLRASSHIVNLCFVSTDKACDPINTYGFSKAIAERNTLGKAHSFINGFGYNTVVRYGNVLNSPMSIIPIIHKIIKNGGNTLYLTSEEMTRFIMTVDQSVDLIVKTLSYRLPAPYAIAVPKLKSMYVKDLLDIFSEEYKLDVSIIGVGSTEKFHEKMIGDFEASKKIGIIRPLFEGDEPAEVFVTGPYIESGESKDNRILFQSNNENLLVSKEELKKILVSLDLLEVK